jgi:hypothetical protein
MALNIVSHSDHEAVLEMVTHWLHRVSNTKRNFPEALADLASEQCLHDALLDAGDKSARQELCIEEIFGAGVNFGIAAALAVLENPFSVDIERLRTAIGAADKAIRVLAESARRDTALVAAHRIVEDREPVTP